MKVNHLHDLNGEQKKQLLVVCDKEGRPLAKATREECHKGEGKTHLAFLAFILDKNSNVILAKRSSKKSLWSEYWDAAVVSHILPGETAELAASRRGKEEMGVDLQFRILGAFYYFSKHEDMSENEYCFCLVGRCETEVSPNPIEISEIKTISLTEVKKDIAKNPNVYTPWLKLALEKFSPKTNSHDKQK